jgi:hypothetical protein
VAFDQPTTIISTQPTASALQAQVQGAAAAGAVPSGNPVLMGGSDGGATRTLLLDATGRVQLADQALIPSVSLTATGNLFSVDCTGYQSIAVQVTNAGTTCTVSYEYSNDNVNWLAAAGCYVANLAIISNSLAVAGFVFPVYGRFFRARVSTYTSGTVTVVSYLRSAAPPVHMFTPANVTDTNIRFNAGQTTTNSVTRQRYVSVASAPAAQVIKATAGRLYSITADNNAAYDVFIKLYNIAAASVTVGTSAIAYTLRVKAGTSAQFNWGALGSYYSNAGWAFAITKLAADTDTTAVLAADLLVQLEYT